MLIKTILRSYHLPTSKIKSLTAPTVGKDAEQPEVLNSKLA